MHVGEIIHKLRKEQKMTLAELSEKSGVALATLSRMENGKMTGTLDSHIKICYSLGITLPELYKDLSVSGLRSEANTQKSRAEVIVHNKHASSEMLVSAVLQKKMLPIIIKIQKGGSTDKEGMKPGMEKFIYVLDGKVEALLGENRYELHKGDTLYFDASIPHIFRNLAQGESRLLSVASPPAL